MTTPSKSAATPAPAAPAPAPAAANVYEGLGGSYSFDPATGVTTLLERAGDQAGAQVSNTTNPAKD